MVVGNDAFMVDMETVKANAKMPVCEGGCDMMVLSVFGVVDVGKSSSHDLATNRSLARESGSSIFT